MKHLGLACLLAFSLPALAETEANPPAVYNKLPLSLAESILKELKIPAEEIGHGVWRLKVDDITIVLYNQFERLQLFSGFAGFKAEPKFINEWNRTRRFSRAYLDDNNDPCLEADLNLQGGVTGENIKVFLQLYSLSVKNFAGQLAK